MITLKRNQCPKKVASRRFFWKFNVLLLNFKSTNPNGPDFLRAAWESSASKFCPCFEQRAIIFQHFAMSFWAVILVLDYFSAAAKI